MFCCNTPNESSPDVEIGLCNIRNNEQEAWFLARFLISPQNFSAVMKASDVTNESDQNPMVSHSLAHSLTHSLTYLLAYAEK